jgi:aminotransferase
MMAVMLACIDPGDEVIVFEPFYENYGPDAIVAGAQPKYVRLREPDWRFDPDELKRAFTNRTRAIVVNTPNNPTARCSRDEFTTSSSARWDALDPDKTDRIIYPGHSHVPIATLPGMAERTVTTNGLSKTFSVTGWRIGWAISPPALTGGIRKLHDFLTVAAPTPFHDAGVAALRSRSVLRHPRRIIGEAT